MPDDARYIDRPMCRHEETEAHHFTADDYPVPRLWRCAGPDGDNDQNYCYCNDTERCPLHTGLGA